MSWRVGSRALVMVLVLGLTAVWLLRAQDTDHLRAAFDPLSDEAEFRTGRGAGDALAHSAGQVLLAAEECRDDHGQSPYCASHDSVAAWMQVAAVEVLRCTAPARFDLRMRALGLLNNLVAMPAEVRDPVRLPDLPRCG